MSYIGVNPHNNIRRFLEAKPISSYPEEALKNIKLLSFKKDKAQPFGSYIYRIQKYPGDLDLVEEFTECCSLDDVVNKFAKIMKKVVKKIQKEKLHYYSEVKAGLDLRYDINIGDMQNGQYIIPIKLLEKTKALFNKKLLSKEEKNIVEYIYNEGPLLGEDEYDTIKYIFRERVILRWSADEILKGEKELPGNITITLKEALSQSSTPNYENHVKIDMITDLNDRLVEVTNFWQLAYEDEEGELHKVNIDIEKNHDISVQMPREIEKLYFSNMYYSPFKMIKRMYSLGRHTQDTELLYKVIPFVSSNTSLLYQIKSEIDTIIIVIEKAKSFPAKLVINELDYIKLRLSSILELSEDDLIWMNDVIDKINKIKNKFDKVEPLKDLKKLIVAYVNMQTIKYLQKVGMNPPPYKYLPPKHTYNVTHIRGIAENPENPYKMYKQLVENIKGGYNVYYPMQNHYRDFMENPHSSALLSQAILANPGFYEEIPEEALNFGPSGEGTKLTAWYAAFSKKYKSMSKQVPINFETFTQLFKKWGSYNFNKMQQKVKGIKEESEEELQDWKDYLANCEDEVKKLKGKNIQEIQKLRKLKILMEDLKEELQDLYYYWNDCEEEVKELNEENIQEIQKSRNLQIQIEELNAQLEDLEEELQDWKDYLNNCAEEVTELKEEKGENIQEIKKLKEQNKILNARVEELEDELQDWQDYLYDCEKQVAQLKGEPVPKAREKYKKKGKGFSHELSYGGFGNQYSHEFRVPLYKVKNLPLPRFIQYNGENLPHTASGYGSQYWDRGYGPSLKGPNINNAPLVIDGQYIYRTQGEGCDDCGLQNFRRIR